MSCHQILSRRPVSRTRVRVFSMLSKLSIALFSVTASSIPISALGTTGTMSITSDTTLTEDHFGNIVIAADGVTLNCDGHSVIGPGTGIPNDIGIHLDTRTGVTVKNGVVTGFQYGICLDDSNGNTLENITATGNDDFGFILRSSSGNTLFNNTGDANGTDFGESGFLLKLCHGNNLQGNTANGNTIGFILESSDNNTLDNCIATLNEFGFRVDFSSFNTLEGNTASNNVDGVIASGVNDGSNTYRSNLVSNNSRYGIRLFESDDNTVEGNTVRDNGSNAIRLDTNSNTPPVGNVIFHNNFITGLSGPSLAFDALPAANDWHHPSLLEGNFWSDYTGLDDGSGTGKHAVAGDGIGDTLIPHPAPDLDNYPFTTESGWIACNILTATDFESPMGTKKKLGSTIPVKFQLFFQNTEINSQEQLDEILTANGCNASCLEIVIFDVTDIANEMEIELPEGQNNVGEGGDLGTCFRYSDDHWIYNLKLSSTVFQPARTYMVDVRVDGSLLEPGNSLFQTK